MNPVDKLTVLFERFPGIGPKQARRFVQYLLASPASGRSELSALIKDLGSQTSQCKKCFRYFVGKGGECDICSNAAREHGLLFVVEKDADLEQVERSGFKGLYFVLGGTIPLGGDIPAYVRVPQLLRRVGENNLQEIILGLSATSEGDHTRELLQEKIRQLAERGSGIKISSLGRGLSTGSELEYADPDTIASALNSRA